MRIIELLPAAGRWWILSKAKAKAKVEKLIVEKLIVNSLKS